MASLDSTGEGGGARDVGAELTWPAVRPGGSSASNKSGTVISHPSRCDPMNLGAAGSGRALTNCWRPSSSTITPPRAPATRARWGRLPFQHLALCLIYSAVCLFQFSRHMALLLQTTSALPAHRTCGNNLVSCPLVCG